MAVKALANHGLSLKPGGLKIMLACVPKTPEKEWRKRNCSMAFPLGNDLLFLSLCLSPASTCALWQEHYKSKNEQVVATSPMSLPLPYLRKVARKEQLCAHCPVEKLRHENESADPRKSHRAKVFMPDQVLAVTRGTGRRWSPCSGAALLLCVCGRPYAFWASCLPSKKT